jgi:large conductance mechanosensitive channel
MKKLFEEYRDFIMKGNLLQTAVAFVMGAAFGKLTESFTAIITSLLGLIGGQPDFSNVKPFGIPFGIFLNTLLNLAIVGFCLFLVVKAYNKMTKPKETPAATDPPDVKLLTEIRDLLKAQQGQAGKTSA